MSLDINLFSQSVRDRRGERGLREIAAEIGTSASTLSRIEKGKLPDVNTFLMLCEWLELPSDYFSKSRLSENSKIHGGHMVYDDHSQEQEKLNESYKLELNWLDSPIKLINLSNYEY